MRKSVKKVISGIMAGMMILTAAPLSAMAADYAPGDVVAKADLPAANSLSPKLDVVWTAYTGKNKAFYLNGDENWIHDGKTVTDLSKVSVEGQTVGSGDCTLKANAKGEYFVAASFILHDTDNQFGQVQFKYTVDSALTKGQRFNAAAAWNNTSALLATADTAIIDSGYNAYILDNFSDLSTDEQYICYGVSMDGNELPDARYQGATSVLVDENMDPETAVVIDGTYVATVGFKVAAGTTISDDLLHFIDEDCAYGAISFGNDNYKGSYYVSKNLNMNDGSPSAGNFEVPMKASAPETKSYTVNYVTEDNTSLGTETVKEGQSPASVPTLPTKAPDAAGHYSYAWDTDPTTATISADTTFTAKLTTTPHNPQTMDSNIVDATCGKDGSKTVTTSCSDCGYVISVENNVVIPATKNHTPAAAVKENVKPATCETAETYDSVVYCSVCGQEISRTQMTGEAALGHKWGEWKHDDSTAKAESKHTRTCENDATHTDSAACNFTSQVTQNQTADQPEITTYTCKDCGYSYTKETAPALAGVTVTVNAVENGSVTLAGQDVTAGGSKKFAENGTYTLVATPNADCTFVGWQTGNKIVSTDASYTTVAIADITYTPVFAESAKPVQFTFVDMFNNVISSQSVASGADVKIPQAPTYTGYTFTGWDKAFTNVTADLVVTAQYEINTYTVTFKDWNGTVLKTQQVQYGGAATAPANPTRTGYTFLGWTGEGITTPQPNVTIPKGSTGDKTYIENWKLTEYNITMDLNGGSGPEKVVYTITDEEFELPTPTRNGYEFVGWTGERITTPQTSVKIPTGSTGNKAYTANWKVIRYTITLVTNGGAVIASIRYTVEDSVTLPIPPDRPGYEFSGWVLDGSGQFPSTPMIIPKGSTGDRIYKAEWRVATYTITYVSHGKAYNWVQYTINNQVYFGTPEEDPSYYLPGYTFVGWKIDGVEGTPRSYMLPKGSYGNRTATMLWEPIP